MYKNVLSVLVKSLSFVLFTLIVVLLVFHSDEEARKVGINGLVIWVASVAVEMAIWFRKKINKSI